MNYDGLADEDGIDSEIADELPQYGVVATTLPVIVSRNMIANLV